MADPTTTIPDETRRARALGDGALIAVFVLGLVLPLVDAVFHLTGAKAINENRERAALPSAPRTLTAMRSFPHDFDAYWGDSFGFRGPLIRAHTRAKLALGASSLNFVAVGKSPWLYYAGEQSMPIHTGSMPMSEEDLVAWQRELEARSDWMASRGGHYVFVIAPNKESIYPEDLPSEYAQRGPTRLDQLAAHMKAHSSVPLVDLRPSLVAEKSQRRLFFYTDTHWNDEGAYVAYDQVVGALAAFYPSMKARRYSSFAHAPPTSWYGDLSQLLGVNELLSEERVELVPQPPYRSTVVPGEPVSGARSWSYVAGDPGGPRAVVFHDSFFLPPEERADPARAATAAKLKTKSAFRVVALLGELFSHATFAWSDFQPDVVVREHADVVVQELVERQLRLPPAKAAPAPEARR